MSFVCSDLVQVSRYGHVSNFVHRILKRFLPGPYTFVLAATKETPRVLQSKQKTVGIRIPDHPVPLALVEQLGNPVVSTSANESNEEVVTNPADLEQIFGHRVDLIMECGNPPGPGVQRDLARERQYRDPARRAGGPELLQEPHLISSVRDSSPPACPATALQLVPL